MPSFACTLKKKCLGEPRKVYFSKRASDFFWERGHLRKWAHPVKCPLLVDHEGAVGRFKRPVKRPGPWQKGVLMAWCVGGSRKGRCPDDRGPVTLLPPNAHNSPSWYPGLSRPHRTHENTEARPGPPDHRLWRPGPDAWPRRVSEVPRVWPLQHNRAALSADHRAECLEVQGTTEVQHSVIQNPLGLCWRRVGLPGVFRRKLSTDGRGTKVWEARVGPPSLWSRTPAQSGQQGQGYGPCVDNTGLSSMPRSRGGSLMHKPPPSPPLQQGTVFRQHRTCR